MRARGPLRVEARLLLGGIIVLAVAVRLAGIGDRLTHDEGYSWLVASAPDAGAFFDRLAAYENTPPLFYALLAALPLDDEAWLRVPVVVAAVLCVPVVYALIRPLLATRIALLAALGLSVAPFHVSYSNYSRAFMLAGLGLLVATLAVSRLALGQRRRWWWAYVAGGALALHAEYYSVLFLLPLLGVPVLVRARPLREVALVGAVPFLTLLPLVGEMADAADQLGKTKISPQFPEPSPWSLRDSTVSLFFGETGTAGSTAIRTLQFLLVAGALVAAAVALRRGLGKLGEIETERRRVAVLLLIAVPAATVVLHAIVAFPGPGIFEARYLTGLLPFAAALLAAGVAALSWQRAMPLAAIGLCLLGLAVFARREGRELEPDYEQAAAVVRQDGGARTVLTNNPVLGFYLPDARLILDRPFGLGHGDPAACASHVRCPRPVVVFEDQRAGGLRHGLSGARRLPPFAIARLRSGQ